LRAQQHLIPDPETTPLAELERHLAPIAQDVLRNPDYSRKLAQNQRLQDYLKRILQREDSYNYGFDSLVTISRQYPADQSFRIFTWQVVQHDTAHNLREHLYFGFVQRKYVRRDGTTEIIVIPLEDNVNWHPRIEAEEHTNKNWLGCLYYKPAYADYGVLSYDGQYQQLTGTGRPVRLPIRYYILLGYNGNDIASNLKVVDVISFDERDSAKVRFGAPIFTISSAVQKYRLVFKYSDNSPFSLNQRLVLARKGGSKKKMMIVFDHLAAPTNTAPTRMYSMGTDGTQDAIAWVNRVNDMRKGFFLLLLNVTPYEPGIEGYDPKLMRKFARAEERRLRNMGALPSRRDPASREAAREDFRREQPGVAFPPQPVGGRELYDPQPPAPAPEQPSGQGGN
jgi:hypothetical protein